MRLNRVITMHSCYIEHTTRSILDVGPMPYPDGENRLTITRISVLPPQRGRGIARSLLKQVCEAADVDQVELWLQPIPGINGGLTREQLIAWYERYGFRQINEYEWMRSPQPVGDI